MKSVELIEKMTLKIVRTGTNKTNFKILSMLPSDINTIMEETKLTKVPINIRANKLERVGLVKRWRGTGLIVITDLGKKIIEMIDNSVVSHKIEEMVKNAVIRS